MNLLDENLSYFAHLYGIKYSWKFDKELESIILVFYNPSKRLKWQKIINVKVFEGIKENQYIVNKIIEEARVVL